MRENLKATKSFTYAGRALKAGDAFAATSGDARVLRAVGRAVTYETAQAVPEVSKDVAILADAPVVAGASGEAAGASTAAADEPARIPARSRKEAAK